MSEHQDQDGSSWRAEQQDPGLLDWSDDSVEEVGETPYQFETPAEALRKITLKRLSKGDHNFGRVISAPVTLEPGQALDSRLTDAQETDLHQRLPRHVESELAQDNWWLQATWQERLENNLLRDQLRFTVGDHQIDLYNFHARELHPQIAEHIQAALEHVYGKVGDKLFDHLKYILLNPDHQISGSLSSEEVGGVARKRLKAVELSPNVHVQTDTRTEWTWLQYAIFHEIGHLLQKGVGEYKASAADRNPELDKWLKVGGWTNDGEWHVARPGPENPADEDNANHDPDEDHADTFAYMMSAPEKLDNERRAYMHAEVLAQEPPAENLDMQHLYGSDIELPSLSPREFRYSVALERGYSWSS